MSLQVSELRSLLRGFDGVVRERVPLAPHTHLRIGGPAEFFVEPASETDVVRVVRACRELELPLRVLGGGSNLVVADAGVSGVVLALARLGRIARDGARVTAGAGASLPGLLRVTRHAGLAGLEALTGIPARVGGAVAMNAGTRDGETFDRLVSLTLLERDATVAVQGREAFAARYRDGGIGERIVLHATFALEEDDPAAIRARFEASLRRRNDTQPVTRKSVGCVFRNPAGAAAARLIDAAGCKGTRAGGVVVSEEHANYFVNEGAGTCADFIALMDRVRERVRAAFGVELEAEVELWR